MRIRTDDYDPQNLAIRTEVKANGRSRFIKFHKDIELNYCVERAAWIVRDNVNGKIVLISYSDARCPEHIQGIGFEIQGLKFDRFKK